MAINVTSSGEATLGTVPASAWHSTVAALVRDGALFCGLRVTGTGATRQVRAAFLTGSDCVELACPAVVDSVASIIDVVPAAAWDEREAADLSGLRFDGHPLQPLLRHSHDLADWTAAVHGRDTHQVAVGPTHAGVIESGHFRFHVVGERILHLDLRLFYKRRGLEALAQGRSLGDALTVVQRACAACAVSNSLAYVHAVEQALGLTPAPDLARARTILAEMERLYNHLNDLSAVCAGVGFAAGTMLFASLKERAQRLNAELSGHRFLFNSVALGRSDITLTSAAAAAMRTHLAEIREQAERGWQEIDRNGSVQARFEGVGAVSRDQALALGLVGPAARAAGVAMDTRTVSPRLIYPDFEPATPERAQGDVAARITMRALELPVTFALLDALLDGGLGPATAEATHTGGTTGMAAVESPRGRTFCSVDRDQDTVRSLRLRTSSFANWPGVAAAAAGNLLPEFPLINKSFELCYACCDR